MPEPDVLGDKSLMAQEWKQSAADAVSNPQSLLITFLYMPTERLQKIISVAGITSPRSVGKIKLDRVEPHTFLSTN